MSWIYRCTNPDCGELDVDKTSPVQAEADVVCGACGQVTTEQAGGSDDEPTS